MKFFGHGSAADDGAAFQDERPQTLSRQIECGDQAVVPAANDHDFGRWRHVLVFTFSGVFQDFKRRQASRRPHDSATRMHGRSAHVEVSNWGAVSRPSGDGPQKEKLFERELALENISLGQAGLSFDVERRNDLFADNDVL
jgi:hypothetical protein